MVRQHLHLQLKLMLVRVQEEGMKTGDEIKEFGFYCLKYDIN